MANCAEVVDGIDFMTSLCQDGTDGPVDAACAVQSCIDRPVCAVLAQWRHKIYPINHFGKVG